MTDASEHAFLDLFERFDARFGEPAADGGGAKDCPLVLASAPGRVELAGNHTDHQGGRTIAAAIDRRAWALARPNGTDEIRVSMEGFGKSSFRIDELEARPNERGTSVSLIRGMAAAFVRSGGVLGGFDMATRSDIAVGSGVSSSAAFEVLVGTAIGSLFDPAGESALRDDTALALAGVEAEREYFGKPCGAQDQLASAHGGIVAMDFSGDTPRISPLPFDADACGYEICLIDSRVDHSEHTDEYALVASDMFDVARFFNAARLEEVPLDTFLGSFAHLRESLGDRSALRALHYFDETKRVAAQIDALQANDFEAFLEQVRLSGASSAQFLQNVSSRADASGTRQPATVILALCSHLLGRAGTWRIHGGGFGGSVLAFVPAERTGTFVASMNRLLGYDACTLAAIGGYGARARRVAR